MFDSTAFGVEYTDPPLPRRPLDGGKPLGSILGWAKPASDFATGFKSSYGRPFGDLGFFGGLGDVG
ncbi:MAG: hypothetical protein ABIU97_02035 [Dehalococcoidia bacterium]